MSATSTVRETAQTVVSAVGHPWEMWKWSSGRQAIVGQPSLWPWLSCVTFSLVIFTQSLVVINDPIEKYANKPLGATKWAIPSEAL